MATQLSPEIVLTRGGQIPSGISVQRRSQTGVIQGEGKAQRTRDRILQAARIVFARHGYQDATVEYVVREAGLARGSFYTYFSSKHDLFRHLAGIIDRSIAEEVVKSDALHKSNPIENLSHSNQVYLAVVKRNYDLYVLVDGVASFDHTVRDARLVSRQKHIDRVAKKIQQWQEMGWAASDVNAELAAALLVSMTATFSRWLYVGESHFDENEALEYLNNIWITTCKLAEPKNAKGAK
jgi:AcrR family transcriptional regulator